MPTQDKNRICPVESAGGLDNKLRKFGQNPRKLLGKYIQPNMSILDFGCGPGFFSIEIAKMLNGSGKVFAVDLQEGMLNIVKEKIAANQLEDRIHLHQCSENKIGIDAKVDFVLAFYVIHEIPDKESFFREVKQLLNPAGKLLVVEPKFHVNRNAFTNMENLIQEVGFKIIERPKIFFSRACLYSI